MHFWKGMVGPLLDVGRPGCCRGWRIVVLRQDSEEHEMTKLDAAEQAQVLLDRALAFLDIAELPKVAVHADMARQMLDHWRCDEKSRFVRGTDESAK